MMNSQNKNWWLWIDESEDSLPVLQVYEHFISGSRSVVSFQCTLSFLLVSVYFSMWQESLELLPSQPLWTLGKKAHLILRYMCCWQLKVRTRSIQWVGCTKNTAWKWNPLSIQNAYFPSFLYLGCLSPWNQENNF